MVQKTMRCQISKRKCKFGCPLELDTSGHGPCRQPFWFCSRGATSEISQTRQCLVISRPGFPVLKGRWSRLHEYLGGFFHAADRVPENIHGGVFRCPCGTNLKWGRIPDTGVSG
jgi:hypothetical protein